MVWELGLKLDKMGNFVEKYHRFQRQRQRHSCLESLVLNDFSQGPHRPGKFSYYDSSNCVDICRGVWLVYSVETQMHGGWY